MNRGSYMHSISMKTEIRSDKVKQVSKMPPPRPQCCAHKSSNGVRCTVRSRVREGIPDYAPMCGTHANSFLTQVNAAGLPPPERCHQGVGPNWCIHNHVDGSIYCQNHLNEFARRERRANLAQERRDAIREEVTAFVNRDPRPDWRVVARELFANNQRDNEFNYEVGIAYFTDIRVHPPGHADGDNPWIFRQFWRELEWGNPAAPPPPPVITRRAELAVLARDGQNVHTRYVVEQTRALEEKLLAVPVPDRQVTEVAISQEWIRLISTRIRWGTILKTINDVHRWFSQSDCRQAGDNLYRRLLRAVVAKINRSEGETRDELYRRLWEECFEATGMCCEGHISRLCNVFVGFDEEFKPPVSLGELLQNKMAAIAMSGVSEVEKLNQATAFFDEVGLPAADRIAWLEAF